MRSAIRSNHSVRLPPDQRVRANKWRNFERIFSDGSREVRYIREIIYGKKRALRYWKITTDIEQYGLLKVEQVINYI